MPRIVPNLNLFSVVRLTGSIEIHLSDLFEARMGDVLGF